MTTSFPKLVAVFTLSIATVAAASSFALAGGGGKKGGGFSIGVGSGGLGVGYNNGNFGVRFGSGNHGIRNNGNYNNGNYNNGGTCHSGGGYAGGGTYNNGGGYNLYPQPYGGQAYEPFHSTYICQPGDSFYTVSLKEYGTSANQGYVAKFNNVPLSAALVPGQRLVLPSISANGQLSPSRRPSADGDVTPVAGGATSPVTQNFAGTAANLASTVQASAAKPADEEELPKVTVGSTLVVDGQTFGEERGVARLRIGGLAFPVEVLEWTNTSTKVRLPQLEVTSPTKADLEILRADGSVVAKSGIELKPAADRLALGN